MIRIPLVGTLALCLVILMSSDVFAGPAALDHVNDVIVLDQLKNLYEPVPFDHKSHAQMADMWDGCLTCHHNQPADDGHMQPPATATASVKNSGVTVPDCKSCHPLEAEKGTIELPSLKGAYHRQCLNCHKDWTGDNACSQCHAPVGAATEPAETPGVDDITGRMHQPIPAPETVQIVARYTPVAGPNVLFRHKEHTQRFGITCASCHRHDNCSNCHSKEASDPAAPRKGSRLMGAGATWAQVHEPCASCHVQDNCQKCHYSDAQQPPAAFDHTTTAQPLDRRHAKLNCVDCHDKLKTNEPPTCAHPNCHHAGWAYPQRRPGPKPKIERHVTNATVPNEPTTAPTSRPAVIRVRRGGL